MEPRNQRNVYDLNAAVVGGNVEVNDWRARLVGCVANVGCGGPFDLFHEGDYLGTADRHWVYRSGAWIELSKAEMRERRIAYLRRELARAEAVSA